MENAAEKGKQIPKAVVLWHFVPLKTRPNEFGSMTARKDDILP